MKVHTLAVLAAGLSCSGVSAQTAQVDGMKFAIPVYKATTSAKPVAANTKSNSSSSSGSSSSSQGGSAQGVGSQGQSLTVDSHAVNQAQERNPVATAVAPGLSSSNDTCMGSTSVGAQGVAFGISFGNNWTDENCLMLKNARELWNMGFRGAAMARLCMDGRNREALESTGVQCPASATRRERGG